MFLQMLMAVRYERKESLEVLTRGYANGRFMRRIKSVVRHCSSSPDMIEMSDSGEIQRHRKEK